MDFRGICYIALSTFLGQVVGMFYYSPQCIGALKLKILQKPMPATGCTHPVTAFIRSSGAGIFEAGLIYHVLQIIGVVNSFEQVFICAMYLTLFHACIEAPHYGFESRHVGLLFVHMGYHLLHLFVVITVLVYGLYWS